MAGYSALMTATASAPPMICAAMKAEHRGRGDPGEGVGEHPADGDGRVGEAGGGGEPVRRADVGADRRRGGPAPARTGPGRRSPAAARAVAMTSDRKCAPEARCLAEMVTAGSANIRFAAHRPGDAAGHLRGQVRGGVPPGQPAERGVGEGHHRVEVAAGDRAEHQDDREQPGRGRRRVLHAAPARSGRATAAAPRSRSRSPPRPGTRCRGTRRSAGATAGRVHWSRRPS